MRGPTLYGSGVPLPEKRSRSISNVSLRILALLFCCEQLILNMRRTSRASLWGSNPTESTTMSTGMRRTKAASVSSARIMTFLPPMDGWMDGPVRHLDYTSANKMNTTRFSSIVALRYCHSARQFIQGLNLGKNRQMFHSQRKPRYPCGYQAVRNQEFTPARQIVLTGSGLERGDRGIEPIGNYSGDDQRSPQK